MRSKFTMIAMLLIGLMLYPTGRCFAASMDQAEQGFTITALEEGGYRYDLGTSGGFVTNVRNNQIYESVYFQFDETVSYDIIREDEIIDYRNGSDLTAPGKYEVYVIGGESDASSFGSLAFTIKGADAREGEDSAPAAGNLLKELSEFQIQDAMITFTYDPDTDLYRQWINKTVIAVTNIPNGMITAEDVYAEFDNSLILSCYKDGEIIDTPKDGIYQEPGSYLIDMKFYTEEDENSANIYAASFRFTIIAPATSQLGVVTPPEGFEIKSAAYGSSVLKFAPDYVFLDGDGTYRIDFISLKEPQVTCTLAFEKDTTAPFLTFDQDIVSRENASAPLTFQCSEADAKIQVLHSGVEISVSDNIIHNGGAYQVIVKDQIGNARTYTFFLENHYSLFDRRLIYVLIALSIAFVVWIIITRKKYRVL